jgi:hypothetical protein
MLYTSKCKSGVVGTASMATCSVICRRLTVLQSGTVQASPARCSSLCIIPMAWNSGMLKKHLMIRQNWIASSPNFWRRLHLPLSCPRQFKVGLSQMSSEPHDFNASLYIFQLVARYFCGAGFFLLRLLNVRVLCLPSLIYSTKPRQT